MTSSVRYQRIYARLNGIYFFKVVTAKKYASVFQTDREKVEISCLKAPSFVWFVLFQPLFTTASLLIAGLEEIYKKQIIQSYNRVSDVGKIFFLGSFRVTVKLSR